jgi:hypothetical protein
MAGISFLGDEIGDEDGGDCVSDVHTGTTRFVTSGYIDFKIGRIRSGAESSETI